MNVLYAETLATLIQGWSRGLLSCDAVAYQCFGGPCCLHGEVHKPEDLDLNLHHPENFIWKTRNNNLAASLNIEYDDNSIVT
jgi:hypothetical protein